MNDSERDTLLRQVSEDVAVMRSRMDSVLLSVSDHEVRLRNVERFRFAFPPVAVLSLLATVVSIFVAVTLH